MENFLEVSFGVHLHHWIVTYPLDKVTYSLNDWGRGWKLCRPIREAETNHPVGALTGDKLAETRQNSGHKLL